MKLEELLRAPEGKTLEYKRDLSSPKPALRTLVAFANAAVPGHAQGEVSPPSRRTGDTLRCAVDGGPTNVAIG